MSDTTTQIERATAKGEWRGQDLWWTISKAGQQMVISDKDLRSWCYQNIQYPGCYVDVIRQYQVDAYADSMLAARKENPQ